MTEELIVTDEHTIPRALKERIQLIPDQLALVDAETRLTFSEFGEQIDKLASALMDLGIQPGEKVALILPGINIYPVAMYAIIQLGGISVGINPTLRSKEFRHIFTDSEAIAVIIAETFFRVNPIAIIREMRDDLPHLRHVIVVGEPGENELDYYELVNKAQFKDEYYQADPDELAILVYTSGTTGLPKGSMHSHRTALRIAYRGALPPPTFKELIITLWHYGFGYFLRLVKASKVPIKAYGATPPYTASGAIALLLLNLWGYIFYQMDRLVPTEILKIIQDEGIHILGCPPATGAMLLKHPDIDKYDLSSLIFVLMGAAPVPPTLVDGYMNKFGIPVTISYGASEILDLACSTNARTDSKKQLRETVGKLNDDYEGKVVDGNRKTLPVGEVGELVLRSKVKMMGYYKAEGQTQKVFDDDGWYFTGDLATIDKKGYVRIVGRVKDLIIRAGMNIYPAELEALMLNHPKIHMVSVVGVPDAIAGEKVVAFIIPHDGVELTKLEVRDYCQANMAPYKIPAEFFFVDDFPQNASGKVLKRELREQVLKMS